MPLFRYKAVSSSGEIIEGTTRAPSQAAVVDMLNNTGCVPIRAEEQRADVLSGLLNRSVFGRTTPQAKDIALFTRQLALLLQAGLPLDRALEILVEVGIKGPMAEVVQNLVEGVRGGASLSDALAAQTGIFPNFAIAMVRAGEAAGATEAALDRLADYLDSMVQLRESVRSASIYPSFVIAACVVSVMVLIGFVLPQFESIFQESGGALPTPTKVTLAVAGFVEDYWWATFLSFGALVVLFKLQLRRPAVRYRWDAALLRAPLLGRLIAQLETARLTRMLGMLLHNGVTLPAALAIARDAVGNTVTVRALDLVTDHVKEGKGLAEPLRRAAVLPELALQLIKVGEETGRLDDMLLRIADIYDREVRQTLDRFLALLVPTLTIGLGLMVAGMIASILMAILSVYELAV